MDVMNVEQAKVAEAAGAVSVMALERIPSLIRSQGGIARMVSTIRALDPIHPSIHPYVSQPQLIARMCFVRRACGTVQSDPAMIKAIIETVSIPVMAKVRIGHFVEAQILQAIGVDYIDGESSIQGGGVSGGGGGAGRRLDNRGSSKLTKKKTILYHHHPIDIDRSDLNSHLTPHAQKRTNQSKILSLLFQTK